MADRVPADGFMLCPHCAEEVRDAATKCRFCGSEINEAQRKGYPAFWTLCAKDGLTYLNLLNDYHEFVCSNDEYLKERIEEKGWFGQSGLKAENILAYIRSESARQGPIYEANDSYDEIGEEMRCIDNAILDSMKDARVAQGTPADRLLKVGISYAELITPLYTHFGFYALFVAPADATTYQHVAEAKARALPQAIQKLTNLLNIVDELDPPSKTELQSMIRSAVAECEAELRRPAAQSTNKAGPSSTGQVVADSYRRESSGSAQESSRSVVPTARRGPGLAAVIFTLALFAALVGWGYQYFSSQAGQRLFGEAAPGDANYFEVQPYTAHETVVARERGIRLRAMPFARSDVAILRESMAGEVLDVTGLVNQGDGPWYQVRLSGGGVGYIKASLTVTQSEFAARGEVTQLGEMEINAAAVEGSETGQAMQSQRVVEVFGHAGQPNAVYGAFAVSRSTARLFSANGFSTREDAERAAMSACATATSEGDCAALYFQNSCAAFATDDARGAWGVEGERTADRAGRSALSSCRRAGGNDCSILYSTCAAVQY